MVAVLLAAASAATLAGCGSGARAAGGRPQVVTAFYPLFEAARRVGGNLVGVTNLTAAGGEPHDLELTSRQVDRIEDAAVVFYLGNGFQPAVERAVARAKGRTVDLLADAGSLLATLPGQSGGGLRSDPHVWLDPQLFKAMVVRIAGALAEADPANRSAYQAGGATYARELDDLDAAFRRGLAACDRRTIVTSHAAFAYLARRYGLTQQPISGLGPDADPDPRRLAALAAQVRAEGTTTIFFETLVSPRVAQTLARETGASTAVLDPIEGLSDTGVMAGKTYGSVMLDNLATLRTALGCR